MPLMSLICNLNIVFSQSYKIPVENTRGGKLILEDFIGTLPVEGYDGKEIIFSSGENDNSQMGLHMERNGNKITVTCLLPITRRKEYKVKVPANFSIKVESGCERSNDLIISNMNNEIDVINCQSITLMNTSGSIVLSTIQGNIKLDQCKLDSDATLSISTISGNIQAIFTQVQPKVSISISSISGEVEITVPTSLAANLLLKTVSGSVFSDFDFPDKAQHTNEIIGTTIENKLNGGGVGFNLSTVSGNISLRKGH